MELGNIVGLLSYTNLYVRIHQHRAPLSQISIKSNSPKTRIFAIKQNHIKHGPTHQHRRLVEQEQNRVRQD